MPLPAELASKEWCRRSAEIEGDSAVGAGIPPAERPTPIIHQPKPAGLGRNADLTPHERPTPITDVATLEYDTPRAEAFHRYWEPSDTARNACAQINDLERQLAEAITDRDGWREKAEHTAIHLVTANDGIESLARELADTQAHLRMADEQIQLERGALAEALEQRDALRREGQTKVTAMAHRIAQIEQQREALAKLAGEMIAMIQVNVAQGTFQNATIEQVNEHLKPWIDRLTTLNQNKND